MRLLDLFCGRWGWSKAFAARGWECTGIDIAQPPEIPLHCHFIPLDIMTLGLELRDPIWLGCFDFICASPPCEEFSVWGMKHFHPNPPWPYLGIELFNHTRNLCEENGLPYVIENVRAAQQFVGNAVHHCGPFYLWGNAVPPLVGQGLKKGIDWPQPVKGKRNYRQAYNWPSYKSKARQAATAQAATIPPELANCVADYAERLLEQKQALTGTG